jgi:hypothetical protein
MANGEAIPLYTKILYPSHLSVPFYSILFVCVAFGIFYLSLAPFQGCRGCRRFLRQPLPSVSPKYRRNRALASSTILKSSVYFLLPAFTTISAIHAIVDMLSVTSRPRFGCYSSVRTGSAGQVSGGKVASGNKATSGSKAGRMHKQTSSSP